MLYLTHCNNNICYEILICSQTINKAFHAKSPTKKIETSEIFPFLDELFIKNNKQTSIF